MNKILLPTDCQELGNYAYDFAHKIAAKTQASIHALAVIPAPANAVFDHDGNIKDDEGEDLSEWYDQKREIEAKLHAWQADKPDIVSMQAKIGHLDEDVVRLVEREGMELVVMGIPDVHGLKERIQGSFAERVVRNSPAPVLSLKCDRKGMEITDILLLSDFRHPEKLKLDTVKELQAAFGARLHLLKVNTPKDFQTTREVHLHMKQFEELNELDSTVFHVYCDKDLETGVANFSFDTGIDFVAIGTHHRKGLNRLFHGGSLAEGLVNHLWQPILTFHL